MKNYDPNIRRGTHTIKVSFQQWITKALLRLAEAEIVKD